ncbi:MAG: DUF4150 domain-containing protein, partial [Oxalobacteraceae bacterium]
MASNYGARKQGGWTIYSLAPNVCKTPMGSSMVPVPYPITSQLSDADRPVESVRLNGKPAVAHSSGTSTCTGDKPGTGGGLKS